jgi:outer membrane protein assembly factor BamB
MRPRANPGTCPILGGVGAGLILMLVLAACGGSTPTETTCVDSSEGCVPDAQAPTTCGPGTYLSGTECLPARVGEAGGAPAEPVAPLADGGSNANDAAEAEAAPFAEAGMDAADASPPDATLSAEAGLSAPDAASDAAYVDETPENDGSSQESSAEEGAAPLDSGSYGLDDAGMPSEAPCFAIDPAHDNAQPGDSIASPLSAAWTTQFMGAIASPVVAGGHVFVAATESQANVRALDVGTGSLVWGPVVFGSRVWIAYDAGAVFALDSSGVVTALDASNGQQLWTTSLTSQYVFESPPVAVNGLVFVNGLGEGGTTYALDESTGDIAWTAGTFDGSDGTVAVAGGVVYEAEACDQLSSFNASTGTLNWYRDGDCTGGGGAAPAVYGDRIWERDWASGDIIYNSAGDTEGTFEASYVPSIFAGTVYYVESGTLSAVDVTSRTLKWTFTGDGELDTSAAIAGRGGQLFVGSSSGKVYEIDAASGNLRSSSDAGTGVTAGSETTSMAIAEGHLFVPAGDTLVVY